MRIGIIGTGNMGRSLGIVWAERGHEVWFGARNAEQARAAAALTGGAARHGTNDEAAAFGEVVFWGIRGVPVSEVLRAPSALDGKIVVDPNNGPIPLDGTLGPAPGVASWAERLAADVPRARVVKAFNTMAQEVFELSPSPLRDHRVSAFLAGDDADAKATVARLAEDIGLVPVDTGPLVRARMLEGMADFIRTMMGGQGLGVYATLSLDVLPPPARTRLGGRAPSRLL